VGVSADPPIFVSGEAEENLPTSLVVRKVLTLMGSLYLRNVVVSLSSIAGTMGVACLYACKNWSGNRAFEHRIFWSNASS